MKRIILFLLLTVASCNNLKVDCEAAANADRQTECLQIFRELPVFSSPFLKSKGKHLITGKECECIDDGRWWTQYNKYLEKGDTIIKRKGELVFSIHKKDTVLNFNWECEGEIYK